jgi:hypothetical protein
MGGFPSVMSNRHWLTLVNKQLTKKEKMIILVGLINIINQPRYHGVLIDIIKYIIENYSIVDDSDIYYMVSKLTLSEELIKKLIEKLEFRQFLKMKDLFIDRHLDFEDVLTYEEKIYIIRFIRFPSQYKYLYTKHPLFQKIKQLSKSDNIRIVFTGDCEFALIGNTMELEIQNILKFLEFLLVSEHILKKNQDILFIILNEILENYQLEFSFEFLKMMIKYDTCYILQNKKFHPILCGMVKFLQYKKEEFLDILKNATSIFACCFFSIPFKLDFFKYLDDEKRFWCERQERNCGTSPHNLYLGQHSVDHFFGLNKDAPSYCKHPLYNITFDVEKVISLLENKDTQDETFSIEKVNSALSDTCLYADLINIIVEFLDNINFAINNFQCLLI